MDGQADQARLRISGTYFPLLSLGPGRRLGVWLQGCAFACAGCMSRHTWDPAGGAEVTVAELLETWRAAAGRGAEGLTVSGGEPLEQPAGLTVFLRGVAGTGSMVPADGLPPDVLVYTGYDEQELTGAHRAALTAADAVITGRFRVAEPTDLVWRGSANQRLIPLTELGRRRYAPHLARTANNGRLQMVVGPERAPDGTWPVHWYGVPRRGELARSEREAERRGVRVSSPSWRP